MVVSIVRTMTTLISMQRHHGLVGKVKGLNFVGISETLNFNPFMKYHERELPGYECKSRDLDPYRSRHQLMSDSNNSWLAKLYVVVRDISPRHE